MRQHVLLVDACQLLWRSHQKNAHMRSPDGKPNGCVVGALDRLIDDTSHIPHHAMCLVWDVGVSSWRKTLYPAYKDGKPRNPEVDAVVHAQMPVVQEICRAAGIKQIAAVNVEADDILGVLSSALHTAGHRVTMIAQDGDLHQLVRTGGVEIWEPMQRRLVTETWVKDRYGFGPEILPDLFALSGQGGDNIPKVPGMGPKKAAATLAQFGTVDGIVMAPAELLPKGMVDALSTLRLAKTLVTIPRVGPEGFVGESAHCFTAPQWKAIGRRMCSAVPVQRSLLRDLSARWGCDHLAIDYLTSQQGPSFHGVDVFWPVMIDSRPHHEPLP